MFTNSYWSETTIPITLYIMYICDVWMKYFWNLLQQWTMSLRGYLIWVKLVWTLAQWSLVQVQEEWAMPRWFLVQVHEEWAMPVWFLVLTNSSESRGIGWRLCKYVACSCAHGNPWLVRNWHPQFSGSNPTTFARSYSLKIISSAWLETKPCNSLKCGMLKRCRNTILLYSILALIDVTCDWMTWWISFTVFSKSDFDESKSLVEWFTCLS